jgi:hypothetical protein
VDVQDLCSAVKQKAAIELQGVIDPGERSEILIDTLYELSRSVLPVLGAPKKSQEYLEKQAAVLDLITFVAIPFIKCGSQEQRGVAVLSELAEGCLDPLLKKKFSVYAHELLAQPAKAAAGTATGSKTRIPVALGSAAALVLLAYLAWPTTGQQSRPRVLTVSTTSPAPLDVPTAPKAPVSTAPVAVPANEGAGPAPPPDEAEARKGDRPAAEPGAAVLSRIVSSQGEQLTRVRIINSQVLVPVTLKNGGGSVRIELLLDTGATRTAIHEGITSRLPIDLRTAKHSQAMVADGRTIKSRIAKIDSLVVGPFAMASIELELIPYHGDSMHDGLLGMDFLGKHRYQIDMEHEVIRWF